MAEIAESAKEGLLALAVGTGLQVMAAMFGEDAERLCGPEGKHNPGRAGAGTAARPGRSPWADAASRCPSRGCGPLTGRGSCTCPAMTCSPRPRSWAGWRWRRCWRACRHAATPPGWSRSGAGSDSELAAGKFGSVSRPADDLSDHLWVVLGLARVVGPGFHDGGSPAGPLADEQVEVGEEPAGELKLGQPLGKRAAAAN